MLRKLADIAVKIAFFLMWIVLFKLHMTQPTIMPAVGELTLIYNKKECDVEWMIPDFLNRFSKKVSIYIPDFSFEGIPWCMGLYTNGRLENTVEYIDLYLARRSPSSIGMEFSFSLKTVDGKKELERLKTGVFGEYKPVLCIYKLISRSDFDRRKSEFLASKYLTVVCTVKRLNSTESAIDAAKSESSTMPLKYKALQDYKELFLKQEDCDVIIKVKEEEFHAHRVILKARSPVLASTFRNDMKEKATGLINIDDCDPSHISDLLYFLYCGEVKNLTVKNAFNLFILSDKYDIPDLRTLCMDFIKENLSIEIFCNAITLALLHSEPELLKLSTEFFAKNFKKIIVTVEWQSFIVENPIHGNEIFIKALVSDNDTKC